MQILVLVVSVSGLVLVVSVSVGSRALHGHN